VIVTLSAVAVRTIDVRGVLTVDISCGTMPCITAAFLGAANIEIGRLTVKVFALNVSSIMPDNKCCRAFERATHASFTSAMMQVDIRAF